MEDRTLRRMIAWPYLTGWCILNILLMRCCPAKL